MLLSGTPTPESFSQIYHQVYGLFMSPFRKYNTFYKFAREYVNVTQKKINGFMINDYSSAKKTVLDEMKPYMISYTQKEAGFESSIKEMVLIVEAPKSIYDMCNKLKKDLVVEGNSELY